MMETVGRAILFKCLFFFLSSLNASSRAAPGGRVRPAMALQTHILAKEPAKDNLDCINRQARAQAMGADSPVESGRTSVDEKPEEADWHKQSEYNRYEVLREAKWLV